MLVLPALVGVENQSSSIRYGFKGRSEHGCHHAQNWSIGDCIADQITVMQVQNRREIQFLPKQAELSNISNPFLVWLFGMEVSVQQIGRDFTHFTLVRAIFLDSNMANQP